MPGVTNFDNSKLCAMQRIVDALERLADIVDDLEETINFSTVALLTTEKEKKLPVDYIQLREGMKTPVHNGAGFDLFVPEDVVVQAGQTVVIPLGFACRLPKGWHALINVRSSTWKSWGLELTNQTGIIDNSYCGDADEWKISVFRLPNFVAPVEIPAGTRLTQFRLERDCPDIDWNKVDSLGASRGGFGSTGK